MKRLAASPLITRSLDVAEKRLGIEELCHRLAVPETSVRTWQVGRATMPPYKFLRLVDILTELDPSWTEWDALNGREP